MTAIPPFRAVVFDLDGTLVDSMPMVLRAYAHALLPYRPEITEAEMLRHMGGPPRRIFERLLGDAAAVEAALARLDQFGAENWRLVRPYPGMVEMLDTLRAAGVRAGVWTGRERLSSEAILLAKGVSARFDACVCGDDLPSHKPDPAGLAEVLRQLECPREAALFVGDAPVDLQAGNAIGVQTLYISHGEILAPALAASAWRVAKTATEAYALVHDAVGRV